MIAIIGGGISGLTAAYQLKKANKAFVLLESGKQLGGKIQTIQKDGFILENGPNTVLVNNAETATLLKELNLWDELIFPDEVAVKSRFILKNGEILALPSSFKSAVKSKLFTLPTLGSVLKEPFITAKKDTSEESLAAFSRRRFGQQIFDDFITPFVTGIYAGDPEKMSINYALNVLKEAEEESGSVVKGMMKKMKLRKQEYDRLQLPKQKIFSFKNGLQHLIKRIEDSISSHVQLQTEVTKVEQKGQGYQLQYFQNGQIKTIDIESIIACTPASALARVTKTLSPTLHQHLTTINYVPAVTLHFTYNSNQADFNQKAFGILSRKAEKVPFLGILFNSHFFPHTSPNKGYELISVICGGSRYPELVEKSDVEITTEVSTCIQDLLGIKGELTFLNLKKWQKGIPQYELGYKKIEDEIHAFLEEHPNFHIAANFYEGISVSDCIKNGTSIGKKLAS